MPTSRARDEPAGLGGDDGHAVGVAEGVGAATAGDFVFGERDHETGGASDCGGDWWERVLAGLLGCVHESLGRVVVEAVDGDWFATVWSEFAASDLGVDPVAGG